MMRLLPRKTLSAGAILRWHVVRRWLPCLAEHTRPIRLLDVGCGQSEYVFEVARRFPDALHVVGVDEQGRDHLTGFLHIPKGLASRVRLLAGRFSRELVHEYMPFDGVLCVDVLEHIPDDAGLLTEFRHVCASGSRLLLHVPATPQWHPIPSVRKELDRMLATGGGEHVREGYSLTGLTAVLDSAGWKMLKARATFGRVAAWWCDTDFFLAGKRRRILRMAALPATVIGALGACSRAPVRGNGWLILAEL